MKVYIPSHFICVNLCFLCFVGNISKARNILNKARLFKFEPTELLVEALKKLDAGETILLSPRHRRYSMYIHILAK